MNKLKWLVAGVAVVALVSQSDLAKPPQYVFFNQVGEINLGFPVTLHNSVPCLYSEDMRGMRTDPRWSYKLSQCYETI
jgi:hypothetical protein